MSFVVDKNDLPDPNDVVDSVDFHADTKVAEILFKSGKSILVPIGKVGP